MKQYDSLSSLREKRIKGAEKSKKAIFICLALFVVAIAIAIISNLLEIILLGTILFLLGTLFLFAAFVSLVIYTDCNRPIALNAKWLEEKGLEHIASDVDINNPTYPKAKICCGNYALVFRDSGIILPYSELIWAYAYEQRINGIRVEKSFRIHTKNDRMYTLLLTPEEFVVFLKKYVIQYSPNFILGYGPQQQTIYNQIVKEEKKKAKELKK